MVTLKWVFEYQPIESDYLSSTLNIFFFIRISIVYCRDEEILLVDVNAWRTEELNATKTAIIATDIRVANY